MSFPKDRFWSPVWQEQMCFFSAEKPLSLQVYLISYCCLSSSSWLLKLYDTQPKFQLGFPGFTVTYHRSDRRFGTLVVLIAQVSVKVRVWCINTWHTVPPSSTGGAASSRSGRFAGAFTSFSCQSPCKMYKRQLLEDQMVASCASCGSYWREWCIL